MDGHFAAGLDRDALLLVLQNIRDGVYYVDPDRVIRFWSKGAERISGYSAAAVAGRPCGDFLMHCDDRGNILCGVHCPVRESAVRRCPVEGRVWLKHADGARIPVNVSANPVLDAGGHCVGIVEIFRDVSEELALLTRAQELESQALIDPLTGVGNRRYAERILEQSWEAWQRYGTHFGVALFDIDHFKGINDRHGHPAGDAVLRGVALTMAGNLRIFDFLGRWGGEEFLAIVQSVSSEDLVLVAQRCRELGGSIRVPVDAIHISATLSAGVASAGECRSVAELVGLADRRLYRAKSTGRNRLVARVLPATPSEEAGEAVA